MTNQNAYEELKKIVMFSEGKLKEVLELSIKALERQIPEKGKEFGYLYCPKCNMKMDVSWEWCPRCGQNISWDDKEVEND